MIYSSDFSEDTQIFAEKIYEAAAQVKEKIAEEVLKKITDKIYDNIYEVFNEWFEYNLRDNFLSQIQHEIRYILREFLNGNFELMEKANLFSEYTFDNLHEIRLAIWRVGSEDIEKSIIAVQQKQIEELKKDLAHAEKRWL